MDTCIGTIVNHVYQEKVHHDGGNNCKPYGLQRSAWKRMSPFVFHIIICKGHKSNLFLKHYANIQVLIIQWSTSHQLLNNRKQKEGKLVFPLISASMRCSWEGTGMGVWTSKDSRLIPAMAKVKEIESSWVAMKSVVGLSIICWKQSLEQASPMGCWVPYHLLGLVVKKVANADDGVKSPH